MPEVSVAGMQAIDGKVRGEHATFAAEAIQRFEHSRTQAVDAPVMIEHHQARDLERDIVVLRQRSQTSRPFLASAHIGVVDEHAGVIDDEEDIRMGSDHLDGGGHLRCVELQIK
jgi:hypothetical protein